MTNNNRTKLFRRKGQALDVPGKMMHGTAAGYRFRGGENYGASGCEGEAYQTLAGDFEIGQTVGCDLDDAARAGERRRDIQVAVHVEGQSLRAAQAFVERADGSVGIDFVNAVGGSGDEKVALRTEGQVISGNTGLERGKHKHLLIARDLEDG